MMLEKRFQEELIKACEIARKEYGYNATRFLNTISKFGGVKTAKEIIRKNNISDSFDKLQKAGRIDLTMEAIITKPKYAELFTDDEVNSCFDLLCEYGYYK